MFTGKVALITGASRGIGAATASLLAKRGATVIVNYINNVEAAQGVVDGISREGGKAIAIRADVRSPEQVDKMVQQIVEQYDRLDILISNANIDFIRSSFEDIDWEKLSGKVNEELSAAFNITKAVFPIMKKQQGGRIVYISTSRTINPIPNYIAHGTAKAALNTFARYVAFEVAQYGIIANLFVPGVVKTDATANNPQWLMDKLKAATPIGRIAEPEDIAPQIAFLASDDCRFMVGATINANGGAEMY